MNLSHVHSDYSGTSIEYLERPVGDMIHLFPSGRMYSLINSSTYKRGVMFVRCVQHVYGYLSLFYLSESLLLRVHFNSCSVACLVDSRFGNTD